MQISINNDKMEQLLKNYAIELDSNRVLEIQNNKLVINNNGTLYQLTDSILNFEKETVKDQFKIIYLKKELQKHLNLEASQILLKSDNCDETVFRINFFANKELYIIVCNKQSAILNTIEMNKEIESENFNVIGPYSRLNNTEYYFRWSDFD